MKNLFKKLFLKILTIGAWDETTIINRVGGLVIVKLTNGVEHRSPETEIFKYGNLVYAETRKEGAL